MSLFAVPFPRPAMNSLLNSWWTRGLMLPVRTMGGIFLSALTHLVLSMCLAPNRLLELLTPPLIVVVHACCDVVGWRSNKFIDM